MIHGDRTAAAPHGINRGSRVLVLLLGLALVACTAPPSVTPPPASSEARTAAYLQQIRDRPPYLDAFLRRMPKGGDLHSHLSGAVYAESYVRWAADDGLCIIRASLTFAKPPCRFPDQVSSAQANRDPVLYRQLIDALSMREFLPISESGHDHFFATFSKFGAAGDNHFGDMLAEVADRAAGQSVSYLELMASPGMGAARAIGKAVGWNDDLASLRARVMGAAMTQAVIEARHEIDVAETAMRQRLHCGSDAARPGCAVTIRFLAQVIRSFPPEQVFAQFVLAFELAKADRQVVGLNLVAPEDNEVAVRDYDVQMRMLGFLHALSPDVKISLHAGELTPALVPREALRSHIRGAVEVAHANRIGHGVDIMGEDDTPGLLAEMAKRRTLVEINLTSNDTILDVVGTRHPFEAYRRAGVPLALSTDDEGVSRIDLTHEYERATLTYGLGYADLKTLARNSLEYAYLPGESLWRTTTPYAIAPPCAETPAGTPTPACLDFLARSEKATAQWRLETEFARFEVSTWPAP
jgi:adenosine deaminase